MPCVMNFLERKSKPWILSGEKESHELPLLHVEEPNAFEREMLSAELQQWSFYCSHIIPKFGTRAR